MGSRDVFGQDADFGGFGEDFDLGDLPPAVAAQVQKVQTQQATKAVDPKAVNQILPSQLHAGNVGGLNRIIWPFYFTHPVVTLDVNTSIETAITITQEAAFIMMQMFKVVYKRIGGVGTYSYIYVDPNDTDLNIAHAAGLKVSLLDAQSTRSFFQRNAPIDMVGSAEFPTVFPAPQMFMPNATITVRFANESTTEVFTPRIILFGYRVRIEDARSLLSLVRG